jgi:Flp pilus assembly pilin Flp
MPAIVKSFFIDRSGATAIEYALISAIITVALIAVWGTMGDQVKAMLERIQF